MYDKSRLAIWYTSFWNFFVKFWTQGTLRHILGPILVIFEKCHFLGGLSLHLNHLYSIAHDNLRLAIWDTSFWTFLVKFGHKGP